MHHIASLFKGMDSVILKRNLKYLNDEDSFIEFQGKSSMIYAISTMIISFIGGFLFNINNYLPMIICIIICFVNILISAFLYESKSSENFIQKDNTIFKWTKILFLIILLYGLLYGILETAQENGKIFIQYTLQDFISINKTAIYLSIIIALSRVARVVSNLFFSKIYIKMKNKFIIVLNINLITAILFLIIGNLIPSKIVGICIMSLGFCQLLWTRDPIMNFLKNEMLNNCSKENQQKAILNFNLSRKITRCFLATLVSLLLLKVEIIYIMIMLFIFSLVCIFFVIRLCILLNNKESF